MYFGVEKGVLRGSKCYPDVRSVIGYIDVI